METFCICIFQQGSPSPRGAVWAPEAWSGPLRNWWLNCILINFSLNVGCHVWLAVIVLDSTVHVTSSFLTRRKPKAQHPGTYPSRLTEKQGDFRSKYKRLTTPLRVRVSLPFNAISPLFTVFVKRKEQHTEGRWGTWGSPRNAEKWCSCTRS